MWDVMRRDLMPTPKEWDRSYAYKPTLHSGEEFFSCT